MLMKQWFIVETEKIFFGAAWLGYRFNYRSALIAYCWSYWNTRTFQKVCKRGKEKIYPNWCRNVVWLVKKTY